MPNDEHRRRPGRPVTTGQVMKRRQIAMDDARWDWLCTQHDSASLALRDMIDRAQAAENAFVSATLKLNGHPPE